jgi:hypothetical protein
MFERTLIAIGLALIASAASAATDIQALLKEADAYRLAGSALQVETSVELYKAGQLDKERRYTVYLKPGRRSLVIMKSPADAGQKVLMLGDDFWQIMPQSQRPIRITPIQKLLGDASAGDIATMTWSEDYDGDIAGKTSVDGVPCLKLDLVAKTRGVSYQRVELYVAESDHRPLRADLYVASDKLAKKARFVLEPIDGRLQVSTMLLLDMIQTGRETRIRYLSRKARTIADEYYNPMFLTSNLLRE